jgi:hypothetical protein
MKEKVGLQINMQQILNVLSSSLYKGDVLQVATRELLQNSFDATKKVANPVIDVYFDRDARKLTFKDNGVGMTSQTVRDVFFTVGGTLKEGLNASERSGGFGIAKVQFFMAAESIDVVSTRNGVSTHVWATQEELLSGSGHIVIEATSDPTGTTVTLVFPRSYVNDRGETKSVSYYSNSITRVIEKPLIGYNIAVRFNDQSYSRQNAYTHYLQQEFDWGIVQMYYSPVINGSYVEYDVHCAGLYQFHKDCYIGSNRGIEFTMNILPKFSAGQREYPFANSRDDFSGYCKPDIDKIMDVMKDLTKFIYQEQIASEYSSFASLDYISVDGSTHVRKIEGESNHTIDIDKLLSGVKDINKLATLLIDVIKKQEERKKADEEKKRENKDISLKFINKTDKVFTDIDREMFSKVASVVYDIIYTTSIRDKFYLNVETCGVIVQNGIGGCCLTLDGISGIYLNPTGDYQNANHFANKMTETLIHELGHTGNYCENHYDEFFTHMDLMRSLIWRDGLYETIHSKFMEIYLQYNK